MGFCGQRGDKKFSCDLRVGFPGADLHQHFALPGGQLGQPRIVGKLLLDPGGHLAQQGTGDTGREQRIACRHNAHRLDQLCRLGVFNQEPAGSGADRVQNVLFELEGGQHDHAGADRR